MSNLKAVKSTWRPVFAWAFIGFFVATGVTVLAMLWLGMTELSVASGVLITMLGMGGGVTGVYAAGRSWEKRHGQERSEYELPRRESDPSDGLGD